MAASQPMSEGLLQIGEFARRTRLPVSTLRYYHDEGVLVAAVVDPVTGYRRYHPSQVPVARVVARLRRAGVGPRDIAAVTVDPDAAASVLTSELDRLRSEIADRRDALTLLESVIGELEGGQVTAPEVVTLDPFLVASLPGEMRAEHPAADVRRCLARLRKAFPPKAPTVTYGAMFPLDLESDPVAVSVFHTAPRPQQPTLELGGGPHLRVRHRGAGIEAAYAVLVDAADARALEPSGRIIELYDKNDDQLVTTVSLELISS